MTGIISAIIVLFVLLAIVEIVQATAARAQKDDDISFDKKLLEAAQAAINARCEAETQVEAEIPEAAEAQAEVPEAAPAATAEPATGIPVLAATQPLRLVASAPRHDVVRSRKQRGQAPGLGHNTNAPVNIGPSHQAR